MRYQNSKRPARLRQYRKTNPPENLYRQYQNCINKSHPSAPQPNPAQAYNLNPDDVLRSLLSVSNLCITAWSDEPTSCSTTAAPTTATTNTPAAATSTSASTPTPTPTPTPTATATSTSTCT